MLRRSIPLSLSLKCTKPLLLIDGNRFAIRDKNLGAGAATTSTATKGGGGDTPATNVLGNHTLNQPTRSIVGAKLSSIGNVIQSIKSKIFRTDPLDVYIRRHRRFLLQTLNHSKFKDQREAGGGIDEVIRPAIEEYRDAIIKLLHAKTTIMAAPEKDRAAMAAAVPTVTLSPEALFVQHVHRLMPIQYRDEIIRADAPPPHGMSPFDCDRLHRMVVRQVATARKMVNYGMTAPLRVAMIEDYNKFLALATIRKSGPTPTSFIVPTMAIDVVWHAHMGMNPKHYLNYTSEVCGFVLNHNDEMSNEDLEQQRVATKNLWESTFKGETYPSNGKTKIVEKGSVKLDRTEHTNHHNISSVNGVKGAYCALPIIIMSSCVGIGGCGTAGQSPATCGACGMTTTHGGDGMCVDGTAGDKNQSKSGSGSCGGCGGISLASSDTSPGDSAGAWAGCMGDSSCGDGGGCGGGCGD